MRTTPWLVLAIAMLAFGLSPSSFAETTDQIIQMAQKGLGEEVLLAAVNRSDAGFVLTADQVIKLKDARVTEKVITAMLRRKPNAEPPIAVAPRADLEVAPAGDGTLNLENVDERPWAYRLNTETKVLWVMAPNGKEKSVLDAHGGVSLRVPSGGYEVRYAGESAGKGFRVPRDEKSLLLISRVETEEFEALYVSIFEKGERKGGGRLAVLRQLKKDNEAHQEFVAPRSSERVVEQEREVESPPATVIYREPTYVYPSYTPYYYAPRYYYPRYYGPSYGGFYYGRYGRRSGFSVGIGLGF